MRAARIGFFIGLLAGAGGTVASARCLFDRTPDHSTDDPAGNRFGMGDSRGLATVEAANNSASNFTFIPMLTLGIPSSGSAAIMPGLLPLYNLTPWPMRFMFQPELVRGVIASLFIGNFMLLAMNIALVSLFARMLSVPAKVLVPFIVVVSAVGVCSGKSASFDLILMVGVGAVA